MRALSAQVVADMKINPLARTQDTLQIYVSLRSQELDSGTNKLRGGYDNGLRHMTE